MTHNITEASLNENKLRYIKNLITQIKSQLPFLINLESDDRKRMYRKGNKQYTFMKETLRYKKKNPQIETPYIDVQKLEIYLDAAFKLKELTEELRSLSGETEDTASSLFHEAFNWSKSIYAQYQIAASNDIQNAGEIVQDLSQYFPRTGKKSKKH